MQTSQKGFDLITGFEGCELTAYPDPGSGVEPWTIGYGHTHGVTKGDVITQAQALQFLRDDVKIPELSIDTNVSAELNQNQFDALVSFIFNVGSENFTSSTLLKKLNAGDYAGAADEFLKWVHANGKTLPGLVERRAAERELFLS